MAPTGGPVDNEEVALEQLERVLRTVRDLESRLETMLAVQESAVNATEPDTLEGRKARLMLRAIKHLRDTLHSVGGR